MEELMSPENQSSAEEALGALDEQLAALSAAAKSLRENRPSWADNFFHPGRRARQEAEVSAAIVSALKQWRTEMRTAVANQQSKITDLERQLSDAQARESANLRTELREHSERMADGTNRTNERVEQLRNDFAEKVEQLGAGQKDLANEFRERMQHLLDEQRVSIRQLALKSSEDAVLFDRARRATELKLEELAKRLLPAPPA